MDERCCKCKHCKDLYIPPILNRKAKHLLCCTLFVQEDRVMYLDNGNSTCECFTERKKVD